MDHVERGRLTTWQAVRAFVFAGNATFTLVSVATGTRFTYKVREAERKENNARLWFVSLLRGPNNEEDFAYMGVIDAKGFRSTKKSRISPDAASHKAFAWFYVRMEQGGAMATTLEVWHEGKCGRCGRKLTVPESVERGIGPECAERMAA